MSDLIVSVPDHCLSFYFEDDSIFRHFIGNMEPLRKMNGSCSRAISSNW